MGGLVLGILAWQEGAERVLLLLAIGIVGLAAFGYWIVRQKRSGKTALIDPDLFRSILFRYGITGQMLQQIALGGMMIVLPIYLQMVFAYNALQAGLSIAPLSLSMFFIALLAGRRAGRRRPSAIIRAGFLLLAAGVAILLPIVPRADAGFWLTVPLIIAGSGLGFLVSQLNNYTLSPITEERVSEAAGVNSAAGSFGLSFGLAFAGALMLASLAALFVADTDASTVLSPDQKTQVATTLEEDAQIMSDAQLQTLLATESPEVQAEILRINDEARQQALQIALLVPLFAALLGFANSFGMIRQPDPEPSEAAEMMLGG